MLTRLLYASKATRGITSQEIISILKSADLRNLNDGITGVLCFGDGFFLQQLEGSREHVYRTFQRICEDPRHSMVQLIEMREIEQRDFPDWTMRLLDLGEERRSEMESLVLTHSGHRSFEPHTMTAERCVRFLTDLVAVLQRNQSQPQGSGAGATS